MSGNKLMRSMMGILFSAIACSTFAQIKIISGTVKDKQSDEPIPFASAILKKYGQGVLTDSLGRFVLYPERLATNDTLKISSVGYKLVMVPLPAKQDSFFISIKMEVLPPTTEAVVKSKYNRALWFLKKIIANKPINDRTRWDNYAYEIYNKLEIDLATSTKKNWVATNC